jgi:16S rRNA (uracil1498-N3)-methyltransferase
MGPADSPADSASGRHPWSGRASTPASAPVAALVFVDDLDALVVAAEDAHHLLRVLRLRPGEVVVAADGAGGWRHCRVTSVRPAADGRPTTGLLEAAGPVEQAADPAETVTVGFVPVKGERPEWVVQKLTELGVDRIVLLRSARSVVKWEGDRAARALERLGRVAREAAAQSRRARLPAVEGIWDLGRLGAALAPDPLRLADPGGEPLPGAARALVIGPEGGWEEAERAAPGTDRCTLGPTVLRAETAAVAAGTVLCALRDRWLAPGPGSPDCAPGGPREIPARSE